MASSTATAPATAPVASTALSAEAFRVVHPLEYHLKFLEQGVRPDGRPFLHARKASANMRQISSAHGSALVRMGDTVVVAGVQCEPCVPSEAEPTRGRVTVSLELAATSALGKRGGASAGGGGGYYSRRELEREHEAIGTLLGRTAMGGLIDLDALVIAPARAVWSCHCSLYVLEHDGNAIDAAFVALLCALRDTRIPAVRLEETETGDQAHVTSTGEPPLPLPLGRPIFSVTFGLLEGYLLLDPSREEEVLLSTTFSVLLDGNGKFCGLHKPGGAPLSNEHYKAAVTAAEGRLPKLRNICEAAVAAVADQADDGV